jgi:hypothetical protein
VRIIEIIYPVLVSLIVAAVITWFIGWGRHLCDKEKLWRHVLGRCLIVLFFLIIAFGVLCTLVLIDISALFSEGFGGR